MLRSYLSILVIAMLVSACANTTVRSRADYESILQHKKEHTVLPGKTSVVTVDIAGKRDRMYEFESFVENNLQDEIRKALSDKGYHAKILTKKEIKEKKIYQPIDRLKQAYNGKHHIIRFIRNTEVEKATNINVALDRKKVDAVSDVIKPDVLVFSGYGETVKTAGERTRDFAVDILVAAVGGSASASADAEVATLFVGLVDPDTGNILWENSAADVRSTYSAMFHTASKEEQENARQKLQKLVEKTLKPLPQKSELNLPKEDE